MKSFMKIVDLNKEHITEVADEFSDAFYNYPVMKYVLGENDDYDNRLHKLVTFFVSARALRNEPMLGIYNSENKLVAAATVTLPGEISSPPELLKFRDQLWAELGEDEKSRYENYGKAASGLLTKEPHHHLNMIGVSPSYKGRGLARQLITSVEELMSSHPSSTGVSLNTELESNINFYLHLGYKMIGHDIVDKNIATWGFIKLK